jgi:methyl-accepting chemotaxis protein
MLHTVSQLIVIRDWNAATLTIHTETKIREALQVQLNQLKDELQTILKNITQNYDHKVRKRIDQEITDLRYPMELLQKMQEVDESISRIRIRTGNEIIEIQQAELDEIKNKLQDIIEKISDGDKIKIENQTIVQIATEIITQVNAKIEQAQQDIENIKNIIGLLKIVHIINETARQIHIEVEIKETL